MHTGTTQWALVLCAALAATTSMASGDWPQWRGASRSGHVSPDSPSITTLPKEAKPSWKIAVGPGFSSPVVAAGSVFYADEQDGKEVLHRLDANTGKEVWSTPVAASEKDEWGSGPRSTPFVDGDRIYVQSMNGEFRCLNVSDGQVRWGMSFADYGVKFVGSKAGEGTASRRGNNGNGIVEGDFAYVPVGAKGASIVCLEKRTGKEVWRALNDEAAYSSFVVGTLAGTRQLVAFTAEALVGVDLQNGKQLWRIPYRTGAKRHAATPIIRGNDVIVTSQTIGLVCSRIAKQDNAFTATEVWANKSLTINLATPVLIDDHLYSYGAIRTKDLVCVDARDGTVKWRQGGFGMGKDQKDYASVIAAGKNVLVLTYDGQLVLLANNPAKYTELSRLQVCGNTWSHPALADGKLYVRDGRELQCIDLSTRAVAAAR